MHAAKLVKTVDEEKEACGLRWAGVGPKVNHNQNSGLINGKQEGAKRKI